MEEIWKDVNVEGFSHLYQVSNLGRVRSKNRIVQQLDRLGKYITCVYKGRILRHIAHNCGYVRCVLKSTDKRLGEYIHRLVALTFIPNSNPNFNYVNHINGIKTDNRMENLEWCNAKLNSAHAKSLGKLKQGVNHFASKPIIQLSMNGEYLNEYENTQFVQKNFGFSNKNVSDALLKKRNSAYGYKWVFKNEYYLNKI